VCACFLRQTWPLFRDERGCMAAASESVSASTALFSLASIIFFVSPLISAPLSFLSSLF
jgi:hypothetical protein